MTTVTTTDPAPLAGSVEAALITGDLSKLGSAERVQYYRAVCQSLGLNHLTRPFSYIVFNNQLQLYARREACDQLAALHKIRRTIVGREFQDGLYVVTVRAEAPDGRVEESVGAVAIGDLKGEARANALMKGETKAKRRATLSIVGLGWLDEIEVETIRGARYVEVDDQGTILGSRPVPAQLPEQREVTREPEPPTETDADLARRHFWVKAAELGFTTPEGKLSKRRVHEALGVPLEDGALVPYAARYGWDYLRHLLEDGLQLEAAAEPDGPPADELPLGDAPGFPGMEAAHRDPADAPRGRR